MALFSLEERKSIIYTTIISGVLLLILLFIKIIDTKTIEQMTNGGGGGVEINFGDSDFGMGEDFTNETLDVQENRSNGVPPVQTVSEEEIIAQENVKEKVDFVVKKETTIKKEKVEVKKEPVQKPIQQTKQTVSKTTNSALSGILGGKNTGGDGDGNTPGNQGRRDGSLSSNNYYGDGGSGGGSGGGHGTGVGTGVGAGTGGGTGGGHGYSLSGRKALSKPKPVNNCNESGRVVVQVTVNRAGKVVNATAGVKGTTNNSSCLKKISETAARNTTFTPKDDAPESQTGTIEYNFSFK